MIQQNPRSLPGLDFPADSKLQDHNALKNGKESPDLYLSSSSSDVENDEDEVRSNAIISARNKTAIFSKRNESHIA